MSQSPLKVDQEFLVTIKRIGINGEGIGYYKKQAVFIPFALVGEEVVAKCTRLANGYAEAEVIRVKKKSPHRCKAECEVYGKCGGCQLQHMKYDEQLRVKHDMVEQALERYTNLDLNKFEILPTIGMENPFNYRNRAQMPVGYDQDGVIAGFYSMNSRQLVYVSHCDVQYEAINHVVNTIVDLYDEYEVFAYSPKTKKGTARHIMVRMGHVSKEMQVVLVMANNNFRGIKRLAREVMSQHPEVKSFYLNINDENTHEILGKDMIHLVGEEVITDELGKLKFNLSPQAFYQLNSEQTIKLYDEVKKAANLTGKEKVVDAYCGVGTIGQWLADAASEVRGVDTTRQAIADAKANAALNNIENMYYAVGQAEKIVPQWINEGFKPDVVVVDPPRTGLGIQLMDMLKRVQPATIVYVSCNPSTLAKNLKELSARYDIAYMQPVDMFPQTSHVEVVVRLVKKKKLNKGKRG